MKKFFIPTLAILALNIGTGCDYKKEKVTEATGRIMTRNVSPATSEVNDQDQLITTDEVKSDEVKSTNSSASRYGAAAGAGALGASTLHHKSATAKKSNTKMNKTSTYDSELEELDAELDELDESEFDRQAMEESLFYDVDEKTYRDRGFSEHQLDELQKRDNIFYGYPGASGASGAPGSSELTR